VYWALAAEPHGPDDALGVTGGFGAGGFVLPAGGGATAEELDAATDDETCCDDTAGAGADGICDDTAVAGDAIALLAPGDVAGPDDRAT